jgi:hypothetical protein
LEIERKVRKRKITKIEIISIIIKIGLLKKGVKETAKPI